MELEEKFGKKVLGQFDTKDSSSREVVPLEEHVDRGSLDGKTTFRKMFLRIEDSDLLNEKV